MAEFKEQLASIWLEIKETVKLNVDYARLTGAEKLTTFLAVCVVALAAILLVSVIVFFISVAILVLIADTTGVFGACMIMAGIYIVFLILLFALRKQLILDPIARFVSTLLLK